MILPESRPEPKETIRFPCPVCGEEHPDTIYINRLGAALGCSACICDELPERWYLQE